MTIDAALRLVIPIQWADVERPDPKDPKKNVTVAEPVAFAYHIPISDDAFSKAFRVIAATKTAIFGRGITYAYQNGARIGTLELLRSAEDEEQVGDIGAVATAQALIGELTRLTSVLVPSASSGFQNLPVEQALKQGGTISPEDWSEALGALVFFTSLYSMGNRRAKPAIAQSMASVLKGWTTSSSPTEALASLKTSTTPETTAPPAVSSGPS